MSSSNGDNLPCEGGVLEGTEEWMDPSSIKFTQSTISEVFAKKPLQARKADDSSSRSGGTYSEALKAAPARNLVDTLLQLRTGSLTVQDIPKIRVCKHDGQFYSLDNRRLWVFKQFGKHIPVQVEQPSKEFFQKLTREGDGESVRFLGPQDKVAKQDSDEFLGIVLKWSVEDILNERMYVNKVYPIPLRFPNIQAYYKAFRVPTLENTRSHIQRSLEAIGSAPYISLESVEELKIPDAKRKNHLRTLKLTSLVGRNFVERNSKDGAWGPKPTDLLLLCTMIPEDFEDLRRFGEHYTLAEIRSADESTTSDDSLFVKVVAYLPEECPEYLEILEGKRRWFAVFLGNLATPIRVWDALNPDPETFESDETRRICNRKIQDGTLRERRARQLVQETLYSEDSQESAVLESDHDMDHDLEKLVEKYCNFRQLNESQTDAVTCTVTELLLQKGFRVRLVQGPPGTGKTSTMVTLLSIVSCLMERTLVCAPTNRAVSEVAQRFLQLLQSSLQDACQFSDFTCPASIGMRFCRPLQVGDVVMIGNEERLDTDTTLGKIFLPHRVKRLLQALGHHSGWRHTAQQVVNFLADTDNEYKMYVNLWKENKQREEGLKEQGQSPVNEQEESQLLGLLQFIRKRLILIGADMVRNGHVMCEDLSTKRLSDSSRKTIHDSCLLVDTLTKGLADESLTDAGVRDCFIGTCKYQNICTGKICPDFCSARRKLLKLMNIQPGFFLNGYDLVPVAGQIESNCLADACLVFSTTSSAGRWCVKRSGPFQYAVIDEAAQLAEAETAIVTQLPGIERALLVGDPQQLQALVTSQIAEDSGYGRSLFERLQSLGHPCHMLNVQYRMHPSISVFPNGQFYNGGVRDGSNVLSERYKKSYQDLFGPYVFIDVTDGIEERDEKETSWRNPVEAEVVQHLITKIRAVAAETSESLDVGVIAPYKSQVEMIMKRQYSNKAILPCGASIQVDVKTVDGFQGGEKDVILFSAVRSNAGGHIGFVSDARRLNVALTRGRYCVWIIGNAKTLAAHDEMWRTLIVDAKNRNCYRNAGDDQGLKKAIIRVKKELEQFASLLHNDSILFKDTIWKIMFSKEFKDTITNIKSTQSRQVILNTVLNLANGRRSPYPTKCSVAADLFSRMIHVQPTAGLTLVWSIDVEKFDPVKQVIRIWNVVESHYVPGLIRRLEAGFSTYTRPYIERCSTVNFLNKTRKAVVPAVWKCDKSFKWHEASGMASKVAGAVSQENESSHPESRLENATVDESILLMKFYSLTSGIARQLLTAGDGSKMELLFEVNEEEAAVIQYPFSTFILGRSGTGKTTVLTTRLLKLEQQFRLAVNGFAHEDGMDAKRVISSQASKTVSQSSGTQSSGTDYLRQVLVTLSPKLCAAIKHHIAKTSRTMLAEESATSTDQNDEEEDVMLDEEEERKLMGGIPDTLVNISHTSFPLVITFRKFLTMVDGSVSCPFFEQEDSQFSSSLGSARLEETGSSLSDIEEGHESDAFSEMDQEVGTGQLNCHDEDEDEDSDDFSLHEDLATGEEDPVSENSERKQSESVRKMKIRTEVTFEHFVSFYWPHFSQDLTKQFHPSVVFTEIISFIKGSLEALHTENGRLTKEQYLSLAVKRTSTFDERQRASIYSIFQLYERHKSVRKEYDIAEYCSHLYAQMRDGNYLGQKFHYVYVDEVQDLTMAQIALFKYVCSNIAEGYVFAGDTAQTIARGVSFRFQEIRHLFYTEFLQRGDNSLERSQWRSERALEDHQADNPEKSFDEKSDKRGKGTSEKSTPHMPDLHHLSHNFRTHVGIVNIANSIVQLLYNFFPNTVDRLSPESSLIQGETPIFLEREDNHEFVTSLFGHGGAAGGGGCDFGAEQVILVRDFKTKRSITEKLGKRGLVMSVLECKGLEFQDVLLYNFFSDSPFGRNWRVIYSYMAENSSEDQNGRSMSFPRFDAQKHNLLMSELKQLYVVVTRSRQRLWIYEECPQHHKPMLDFWNHSGLVQVKRLDEDLIQTIHGKSTPDDWKRRGIQMFNDHHYDMAQLSFERAGDLYRANWAQAAGLQQAGERLLGSDTKASAQLFREAATLYLSLGKGESAGKCYLKIGEDKKAGIIFRDSCKPPLLKDAGDCFMDAKCWKEAAEAYSKEFCVRQCLQACLKGKLLDLGADFVGDWEQQLNSRNQERGEETTTMQPVDRDELEQLKVDYLQKCALHYHKQRNIELMMKFVRRFPSVSSQKVFLKRRDYFDQLIQVEEEEGNFLRAAEMAEQKGDLKHAVMLLVRAGCHEKAVEKLLDRARFEMLWSDGKQGWPLIGTPESQDLLEMVQGIISSRPHDIQSDAMQELQLLLDSSSGLQNWKQLKDSTNIRFQMIAGRKAIDELQVRSTAMNSSWSELVPDFLQIWDLWSQKLTSLIQAIDRAQRRRHTVEDEVFLDSSNTYLGVKKHAQPHLFLVADVSSSWLKNSRITRLPNQGQRGQVSSSQVFSLSETFWATQLWQVGLGIMKVMDGLLFNSSDASLTITEAARFSHEFFQPRGELLCKLYSIAKTLTDIMSKNIIQDEYLGLRSRLQRYGDIIYHASFPYCCSNTNWRNVLTFRREVGATYDSIATGLVEQSLVQVSQPALPEISFDTVGRLQMLLPLLSRQWIRKYGPEIQKRLRQDDWSHMWEKSLRMYSNPSEDSWQSPENECAKWVDTTEIYCGSMQNVYKVYRNSIRPFVFMQLLERGIVVDLACHTNLHGLVLPQSLVIEHMTGDMNLNLYSAILNVPCNCKGDCFRFSTLRFVSRLILDMLNSSSYALETWFDKTGIDWRESLHSLIFRMLVSVLTICINLKLTGKNFDRDIWNQAITTLRTVFWNHSPLLRGLPTEFYSELRRTFTSPSVLQDDDLRLTFKRAMAAIHDPLVVLKHGGSRNRIAHRYKFRYMIVTRIRENRRVFETDFESKKKPARVTSPKVESEGAISADLPKLEPVELHSQTPPDENVNTLLSPGPCVAVNDSVDGRDESVMDEEDQSPDVWVGDDSTDDPRLESQTIPAGHVSIGEGQTVAIFIKGRLLQLLDDARQRLKEELSATEKYRRDARTTFCKLNIKSKKYVELFLSEACPLKATTDEWLQELEIGVQALKDDDSFDDIADSQDVLQKAVCILDPGTDEHLAQNLKSLEEKLAEVRCLLEAGKASFQKQIRILGIGWKDANHSTLRNSVEGEINIPADQGQVTKSQKSKHKPKNKKKRKGKR